MITGTGDERVAVEAMKLGAGDYIVKDVEEGYLKLLPSVIEKVLQQRRAVEERQHAEEAYSAVVEHSLQGLHIIQEGREVFVNSVYAEMLGYTEEELLALTPAQVQNLVHPEDRELVSKHYRARIEGKIPSERYEFRIIRKDGSVRWVEAFASRSEYRGKPASQLAMIDITERKQIEEALRQTEERYRTLVETMKVGLAAIDEKGVNVYANEQLCNILGYSMDEVIGRYCVDFLDEEYRQAQEEIFAKRREGMQDTTPYEVTWRRKDGRKVHTIMTPTPSFDADGHFTGSFAILTDITERKQMELELRESEEKYRFLFENSQNVNILIGLDGKIIDVNKSVVESLGYEKESVIGKDVLAFVVPEQREGAARQLARVDWHVDQCTRHH